MTFPLDNNSASDSHEQELIRLAITGKGDDWNKIRGTLFSVIDRIAKRVEESAAVDPESVRTGEEFTKSVASIFARWSEAKIERPSLENDKIRGEIIRDYEEALKTREERLEIEDRRHNDKLVRQLDLLERLMKLAGFDNLAQISFEQHGQDAHLLIGPSTNEVGDPSGDQTTGLSDHPNMENF